MFGDKVSPVLLISRRTLLRHAIVAGASSYIFVLSVSASSDSAKREYSDAAGRTYLYVANSGEATGVLFARDLIRHQQLSTGTISSLSTTEQIGTNCPMHWM